MLGHGAAFGRSGSGKSNASKYLHANVNADKAAAVYVNPHEEYVPRAETVHTVPELITAARRGARKIDWHLPDLEETSEAEIRAVLRAYWAWMKRTGKRASKGGRSVPPWLATFFGEAQLYAPNTNAYTAVDAMLYESRKFGGRVVVESQTPAEVTSASIKQARWIIVYRVKKPEWIYLSQKGIPVKEFDDHVRKEYHFVVVDDDLWTPYNPWPNMD